MIIEVGFCPVLCILEVAVFQAFQGISHFVWYCKAVSEELIRKQKQQIKTLEEERQMILFDRQRWQEEVRKSTVEIQRLTTELSETQKLNQSFQQRNDALRNRNGLKGRSEQEQLEDEIKDVRVQNSKL